MAAAKSNYTVMVTRTRTLTDTVEIDVKAKNEEAASELVEKQVNAMSHEDIEALTWDFCDEEISYEYEASS